MKNLQSALVYYGVLPLLYLASLLPRPLLYGFSRGLSFLLIFLIPYRKKVITQNIERSFPEWNEDQVQKAVRGFYRHLSDLMMETIKVLTISAGSTRRYMRFGNREEFEQVARHPRGVVVLMAHYGSWELAATHFAVEGPAPLKAVYRRIGNRYFDRLFVRLRSRHGNELVEAENAFRDMIRNRETNTWYVFIADQSADPRTGDWLEFMHQDTLIFGGPEKIARKLKMPVVYVTTRKESRGRYRIDIEPITMDASQEEEGKVMRTFFDKLEKDVRQRPETWLWSHRRWKHKRKVPSE